jgi:hypothetical protein
MNGILLLILPRHKVLNSLFETAFDFQLTDATTNWCVKECLSSKEDELFILFELVDSCIPAVAFNAVFAELMFVVEVTSSNTNNAKAWHETFVVEVTGSNVNNVKAWRETFVVEVMGSNANNVKAWRETVGVEDTWTFTARDWTILDDNPYWNEQIVEKGSRADEKLCGLAECKCASWFVMVVACDNPLKSRLIGVGIYHWLLELLEAAFEWSISSAILGWSAKDSGSDFLPWYSPRVWVFVESVSLLGGSASCFVSLFATQDFLVGSPVGSFIGLLIGSTNWNHWFTWTWFPATGLRLVNAFALLAKRKIANSTKNVKRAGIAFIPFLQLLFNIFLNAVSDRFSCVT